MEKEEYDEICHELRNISTILGACACKLDRVLERWRDRYGSLDNRGEGSVERETSG